MSAKMKVIIVTIKQHVQILQEVIIVLVIQDIQEMVSLVLVNRNYSFLKDFQSYYKINKKRH